MARSNLAALLPSGEPAPGVAAHTFDDTVFSLTSDGATVYAGGAFTLVDGTPAKGLARFDGASGIRIPLSSGVSGIVYATALAGGRLYVGGKFGSVQGASRFSLAAIDASTGVLDRTWVPSAKLILGDAYPNDGGRNSVPVRSIAVSPDAGRVYIAGDFDILNELPRAVIAAVHPTTGATDTGFTLPAAVGRTYQGFQIAVVDGTGGRTPGVMLAGGGIANRSFRFNLDGTVAWKVDTDGDAQAVAVIGDSVFLGGHFTRLCLTDCRSADPAAFVQRTHIAALPYEGTSTPAADPTWAPVLGPTQPPYFLGVWTLQAFGPDLHVGGLFNFVSVGSTTYPQPKYARFTPGTGGQ